MTNSHPPTALGRDLVLSDEDLAETEAALMDEDGAIHTAVCEVWSDYQLADCDCGLTAFTRSAIAEVRRQRSALRQVRAAIEGRTGSVNVSVILSALGEQE